MKYLLDTQVLLWAAAAPERLPGDVCELLEDVEQDLYFSVASLWELAARNEIEPDSAGVDPRVLRGALLARDYEELAIVALMLLQWTCCPGFTAIHSTACLWRRRNARG